MNVFWGIWEGGGVGFLWRVEFEGFLMGVFFSGSRLFLTSGIFFDYFFFFFGFVRAFPAGGWVGREQFLIYVNFPNFCLSSGSICTPPQLLRKGGKGEEWDILVSCFVYIHIHIHT